MRKRTAFTLIEVLVVLLVVAVLLGLLFPLTRTVRERGQQAKCVSNLAQLGKALHLYADDWNGCIPPYNSSDASTRPGHDSLLARAFAPYLREPRIWFCPSDPYAGQGPVKGVDSNFSHQYGSYPTSPFVPPVIMEPGHRSITTPWRLDQPGPLPDQSTSEVVYLADWFMDEIKETVSHNRRGNQLLFDGRVVSTIIPALGKHSPPPPPPL